MWVGRDSSIITTSTSTSTSCRKSNVQMMFLSTNIITITIIGTEFSFIHKLFPRCPFFFYLQWLKTQETIVVVEEDKCVSVCCTVKDLIVWDCGKGKRGKIQVAPPGPSSSRTNYDLIMPRPLSGGLKAHPVRVCPTACIPGT